MEETFWNGVPVAAFRGTAVVSENQPWPQFWGKKLVGQRIACVRVELHGAPMYLDNRDESGWRKVTEGHGGPAWPHRNFVGVNFIPEGEVFKKLFPTEEGK